MSRGQLYKYAILALPLSFAGLPLYLYLPDLYTTQYGLSLATIGFILLGIRFVDAFQDPLIGEFTKGLNYYKTKLKKAIIYIAGMLVLGMFLITNPMQQVPVALWFAASMIVCTTAFSAMSIIYQSIGAVWKKGCSDKTKITTTREGFGLAGIMLAAVLPNILAEIYDPKTAFKIFFLVFFVIIISVGFMWLKWLAKTEFEALEKQKKTQMFGFLKLKSTRPLYVIWFLSQLASAIPVVLLIFYVRDVLQLEGYIGAFLLLYFLSGIMGMPLWQVIEKAGGKARAWQLAMLLGVISFFWAYFLGAGDAVQYGIICVFSGIALGGELAIPPSILADKIQAEKATADSTKFFGISTLLGKFALALASGIVLPLLAAYGYSTTVENSGEALGALAFSYALLPCVIKIIALISLFFIKLEGTKNENQEQN